VARRRHVLARVGRIAVPAVALHADFEAVAPVALGPPAMAGAIRPAVPSGARVWRAGAPGAAHGK